MLSLRTVLLGPSLACCFAAGMAETEPTPRNSKSPFAIEPFAGVVAYAASHGITVQGVESAGATSKPQPGDEVVYLLTLQQKTELRQWLVRITAGHGDGKAIPDDIIYTTTGQQLRYTNTPAGLDTEFIGPFETTTPGHAKIATRRGHAVVSAESLETGLARYCESSIGVAERLKTAGIEQPVYYGAGSPLKPDVIEAGRKHAALFGLTLDEERLAFSVYFALRSFYFAASEIPACSDVLGHVLQKPSPWSVAANLGLNTNFQYGWQKVQTVDAAQLPVATPVYILPVKLDLNGQPALEAGLAVTGTEPPLRNCAGIVALVAVHPKDPGKCVYLRLLSAHPAKR